MPLSYPRLVSFGVTKFADDLDANLLDAEFSECVVAYAGRALANALEQLGIGDLLFCFRRKWRDAPPELY
jgi:hypothetical protein